MTESQNFLVFIVCIFFHFFHPLHRHIYLSPAFILQQNRTKNPKLFLKDSLHISLQFIILGGIPDSFTDMT